jgi:hypothetical protein
MSARRSVQRGAPESPPATRPSPPCPEHRHLDARALRYAGCRNGVMSLPMGTDIHRRRPGHPRMAVPPPPRDGGGETLRVDGPSARHWPLRQPPEVPPEVRTRHLSPPPRPMQSTNRSGLFEREEAVLHLMDWVGRRHRRGRLRNPWSCKSERPAVTCERRATVDRIRSLADNPQAARYRARATSGLDPPSPATPAATILPLAWMARPSA